MEHKVKYNRGAHQNIRSNEGNAGHLQYQIKRQDESDPQDPLVQWATTFLKHYIRCEIFIRQSSKAEIIFLIKDELCLFEHLNLSTEVLERNTSPQIKFNCHPALSVTFFPQFSTCLFVNLSDCKYTCNCTKYTLILYKDVFERNRFERSGQGLTQTYKERQESADELNRTLLKAAQTHPGICLFICICYSILTSKFTMPYIFYMYISQVWRRYG